MKGSPVQQSPVQSVTQSGPPMKTQGGGPSFEPPRLVPTLQPVLLPKPRAVPVEPEPKPKKRRDGHYGGGGGGIQPARRASPPSSIQAQQNRGANIVNRENRSMPADYRGHETSDRGRNGVTTKRNDPGGMKRGQVSAQTNGGHQDNRSNSNRPTNNNRPKSTHGRHSNND